MITLLLFPLVAVVGVLVWAYGQVSPRFVTEWAGDHALVLTSRNRPLVDWYLRTARILRTWGALGGGFLAWIVPSALGFHAPGFFWVSVFAGFLTGALYAERSVLRPTPAGGRTDGLVRREPADYLPHRFLATQRLLAVAIAAGAVAAAVAPYGHRSTEATGPHGARLLAAGIIGVGLAVGLERIQRWVVQRPLPFTEPALVAANDAIRAQSVNSVTGSGLAALVILAGFVASGLAASDVAVLRWTMLLPASLCLPAALIVWVAYGRRISIVPRPGAAPSESPSQ